MNKDEKGQNMNSQITLHSKATAAKGTEFFLMFYTLFQIFPRILNIEDPFSD